ncbi:MAG: chemotaxis protein CheX [Syntrophobacter sp.]
MITQWEPILKDVISDVLETMFFAMVDFDEDCEQRSFDYRSEICIVNHQGRIAISLCLSGAFARMITANLLGIDEEQVGEDDLRDTLRELTNMVGGSYHARMKNHEWSLGIPRAWKIEEMAGAEPGATGLRFSSYGEPIGAAALEFLPEAVQN